MENVNDSVLSDGQVENLLNNLSGETVTKEYMESRIVDKKFITLNDTVTVCNLTLDNGYSVRGESACVDPSNYRKDLGEHLSYLNSFNKLWSLFGFLLAEKLANK